MTDSRRHPLAQWMDSAEPPLRQSRAAEMLGVSEPYLSQVLSWKRAVSMKRAAAWSRITGLPVDAFVMTEAAE